MALRRGAGLDQQGFTLMRLIPGFTDQRTGQMMQADGVFFRI